MMIYSCFALDLPEGPGRANGNGEIFRYGAAKVEFFLFPPKNEKGGPFSKKIEKIFMRLKHVSDDSKTIYEKKIFSKKKFHRKIFDLENFFFEVENFQRKKIFGRKIFFVVDRLRMF